MSRIRVLRDRSTSLRSRIGCGQTRLRAMSLLGASALIAAAAGSTSAFGSTGGRSASSAHAASGSTITVGFMGDFSGSQSFLGPDMLSGVKTAIAYINANGGVLGKKLTVVTGDSVGDPVDAIPAFHKLISINHIVAELGPTSNSGPALIPIATKAHIPIFIQGGTTLLDHENDPYFFRTTVGDGVEGKALAYFARSRHWGRAAFAFTSSSAAQTLATPIAEAFKKHGGKVVASVTLVPDTSSYRSEIQTLENAHPDVVFFQQDPQTAGTFFQEVSEAGFLSKTNWVGTDTETSSDVFKAVGSSTATKFWMGLGATVSSPALKTFNHWYTKLTHNKQPLTFAPEDWDATTIMALAMLKARTTNGAKVAAAVMQVTQPRPGAVTVYNFAQGAAALKAGKQIKYSGVASADNFNKYHNVFGPMDILRWSTSGLLSTIKTIPATTLFKY